MWQHPFPESTITGKFGTRSAYRIKHGLGAHRGVDYAPGVKSLIPAVTSGRVELIQWSDVLGWVMVQSCSCPEHTKSGKHYIGYCHLSCTQHGPYCKGPAVEGCKTPFKSLGLYHDVKIGQPVGRVGSTGSASSAPHLHITLGTTLKSVFYGKVYDIQKKINKEIRKADAVQRQEKGQKEIGKLGRKYGRFWTLKK